MPENIIRKPAVAGQFYPRTAAEITEIIQSFLPAGTAAKINCSGCVLPHAGYIYSGSTAVKTISSLKVKDTVVLLGPNHTGYGAEFSIMSKGEWITPLGKTAINSKLAQKIAQTCGFLEEDELAHAYEHSIEVQLPILQYFRQDFKIVPIAILSQEAALLKELGEAIAKAIIDEKLENSVLIAASSDMTHYEPQDSANKKDSQAIQAILNLDTDELTEKVKKLKISMCGYAPVTAMLTAVKLLGAKTAKLVQYETSAAVTQDKSSVVGYAGITIC